MKKTQHELELIDKHLSTPSPFLCRFSFHKWSKWVYEELVVVKNNGKPHYTKIQQRRICLMCKIDKRRYVNP